MTIEVFRDTNQVKADSLFQLSDPEKGTVIRSWQNSEHWWTSLFSLLALHLAKHPSASSTNIPIRKLVKVENDDWHFETVENFDCTGLKFSNIAVEARLTKKVAIEMFGISDWPNNLSSFEPDITIFESNEKRAVFIETKTVRGRGGRLKDYPMMAKYLREQAHWKAKVVALVSFGYDDWPTTWKPINDSKGELLVILWEDILRVLDEIEIFRSFFDVHLKPYYEQVIPCAT